MSEAEKTQPGLSASTPGPWKRNATFPRMVDIRDSERRNLATVWMLDYSDRPITEQEMVANSHLIEAAPELLSALEDAVENCGCSLAQRESGHHIDCFAPRAKEVIAKARGEL